MRVQIWRVEGRRIVDQKDGGGGGGGSRRSRSRRRSRRLQAGRREKRRRRTDRADTIKLVEVPMSVHIPPSIDENELSRTKSKLSSCYSPSHCWSVYRQERRGCHQSVSVSAMASADSGISSLDGGTLSVPAHSTTSGTAATSECNQHAGV